MNDGAGKARAWSRWAIGLVALAAVMASGCTDRSPQVLFVQYNQAVDRGTACTARAGSGISRPIGWMDIAVTNRYMLFPAVENGLPPIETVTATGATQLRLENNKLQITGATIYYDLPPDLEADLAGQGVAVPQGQFVFTSGSLQPGEIGALALEAVPPLVGQIIRLSTILKERYATTQILVRVTVEGVMLDGDTVNSNEFVYPLNVCNGCLVYFPIGDCTVTPDEPLELPCFPGQDEGLDCRACYQLATTKEEAALCLPPVKK